MERKFEEITKDKLELLVEYLDTENIMGISELLDNVHSVDIAEVLLELSDEEQKKLFQYLPSEIASEVLEEVDSDTFNFLIKLYNDEQQSEILDNMADDDIADLLGELSENNRDEIINLLDIESAEDVKELLVYEDDTAGGIMTKDFVALSKDYTIYHAIEMLREYAPDAETIYYVFVVDKEEKLVGVISLRDLIVAKPNKKVEEIMNDNVIYVNVYDDQEEVAKVVSKYDLLAVPVVDDDKKMIGLITVDDIIDVLEEEATEDILKFAGSNKAESYEEEAIGERIVNSVKARLPWLIITIFGGLLSAQIIKSYQYVLDANTTVALFMPILAGMGGNVGTQSSTLTVRSIAVGQIKGNEVYKTILHEISVGLIVGMICSVITGVAAIMLNGDVILALIVGLAMWCNIITAATIGTLVPLIFRKIGVDPAVASAPFITTTVDITGMTIYYSMATLMIINIT
ncbi:MAG: magnesium transporter [Clostridiales bacterium]|nr:magnesium transporter [Clostridiales bacterium]